MSMVEVGYHAPVLGDQWAGGAVDFFKTGHPPGRGGADVLRKALCQWDPPALR